MNKTILIGINNNFSIKVNRWLFPITGLLFIIMGARPILLNEGEMDKFGLTFAIMAMVLGLYYCIYGFTAFSNHSKFALRINITDKGVLIKDKFLKSSVKLKWSDIQSIEFGQYKIIFQLEGSSKSFRYKSNADVSVEIKKILREVAHQHNIEVVGG